MKTIPRCPVLMLFVVVLTGLSLPRGTRAAEKGDSKPPEVGQPRAGLHQARAGGGRRTAAEAGRAAQCGRWLARGTRAGIQAGRARPELRAGGGAPGGRSETRFGRLRGGTHGSFRRGPRSRQTARRPHPDSDGKRRGVEGRLSASALGTSPSRSRSSRPSRPPNRRSVATN